MFFYNHLRVKDFLLAKQTNELLTEQSKNMEEQNELTNTLQKMSQTLIEVLGDVVEGRDSTSGSHVQRIRAYTFILANQVMKDLPEYGLDKYTINLMTLASALHDVGKIYIPDAILFKPTKLNKKEFELMKTHCEKGCEIIKKMESSWSKDYLNMGLQICMSHHEKWDGRGYPHGLKGDEIPIAAQIVSIADCYDALTTDRPYKQAYSSDKAYRMILNGECGEFSDKLLSCFKKCKAEFERHMDDPNALEIDDFIFEVVSSGLRSNTGFVIGLHDHNKTLQEKVKLSEELAIISNLSDEYLYIVYVDLKLNQVIRFKANEKIAKIIDGFSDDLPSNEKFDKLLDTIIVKDDYDRVRRVTERETALEELKTKEQISVGFRIELDDGVHFCRMRVSQYPLNPNAVVIGIMNIDEEHERELKVIKLKEELAAQNKLQDQLAVINYISDEYDYVCTLNSTNMEVTVYKTVPWISDMFNNLKDVAVSSKTRDKVLEDIIYPEDFPNLTEETKHENILKGLKDGNGQYFVNYRVYKCGQLVYYQTKYLLDKDNPNRIIIAIHNIDGYIDK